MICDGALIGMNASPFINCCLGAELVVIRSSSACRDCLFRAAQWILLVSLRLHEKAQLMLVSFTSAVVTGRMLEYLKGNHITAPDMTTFLSRDSAPQN